MNKRKDEKIQLYRKLSRKEPNTTKDVLYRQFIYSEEKFLTGGLYAYARDMSTTEIVSNGLQQEKKYVKFTVNRNPLIEEDLKVIYRGEVYDITPPIDNYDGRSPEITFMAVKTPKEPTYKGDLFND